MADETSNTSEEQQEQEPQEQRQDRRDDEQLGQPGLNALRAERDARKTAERELAATRDRLKEFEDRDKTELQKANERAEAAEKAAAETQTRYKAMVTRSAIEQAAQQAGAIDPEAVYLIAQSQGINYDDDGQPVGVADTIKALTTQRPHLFRTPAGMRDAAATGAVSSTGKTMDDYIRGR